MTLILTGQTRGFTFQVADRLVSVAGRGAGKPYEDHDDRANKNIVLLAGDSLVSAGYTGLAYVADGRPTDRWIAEQITGASIESGMGGWAPPGPMHLNAVVERLRTALVTEFARLPTRSRRTPLEIVIAGQQRRRNSQARPILWHITHEINSGSFQVTKADGATFRWDSGFRVDAIGSVDPDVFTLLRSDLKERGNESPTTFRDILVDAVRATSARKAGVGRDVMTIALQAGAGEPTPNVDIEYLPHAPQRASVRNGTQVIDVPTAYSPYLIVPGWIWTPAVIEAINNEPWHMGGITIRLRAPLSGRGTTSVSGQRRRPPPR